MSNNAIKGYQSPHCFFFYLFYKGPNHVFISLGVYKSGFIINMSHLNGYVDTKLEVEVKLKESLIRC